ncbi:hypothetical protein HanXRQr2_Chr16g0742181 [Helianthus annuus]|uniref:Uncharacterized protein n=1 Tax=Helianthus annuus TaxID=4232 RepID=A0A9K3DRN3_HELAN|nr:hypothetical protein HanXRQr2_Chr16g0742181 [Helianthus annuus]KAJ0820753.1 hypothetical protein HanPSC8_Chr16g0711751 [Helianthus annuus]
MNLVAEWQSLHTLRFFATRIGTPGGRLSNPKAIARRSLCPHSKVSFSSSFTLCRTHDVSGT